MVFHYFKLILLLADCSDHVLHGVSRNQMNVYFVLLSETVGPANSLIQRFEGEVQRGKYLVVAVLEVQPKLSNLCLCNE